MAKKVEKVWAYRDGQFESNGGEWDISVPFVTLQSLVNELNKAQVGKKQLLKLGLFVHGDPSGGIVDLDRDKANLTASSASIFSKDFQDIRNYLQEYARIIFYSCLAGSGLNGTSLLNFLSSKYFPECYVIGFNKFGYISKITPAMGVRKETPGNVWCSTMQKEVIPCDPRPQILNEYSIFAKWSFRGKVIKLPIDEKKAYRRESFSTIICGPESVKKAVKDPNTRKNIEYIYITKAKPYSKDIIDLFSLVQDDPYNFKYGTKLLERDPSELNKLAGNQLHKGIIAVGGKKVTTDYKCAYDLCPTHKDARDDCDKIYYPNGPFSSKAPGQLR